MSTKSVKDQNEMATLQANLEATRAAFERATDAFQAAKVKKEQSEAAYKEAISAYKRGYEEILTRNTI